MWEETRVTRGNPFGYGETMQLSTDSARDQNWSCETADLLTEPLCYSVFIESEILSQCMSSTSKHNEKHNIFYSFGAFDVLAVIIIKAIITKMPR